MQEKIKMEEKKEIRPPIRYPTHYYLIVEVISLTNVPKRFLKPDPFILLTYQGLNNMDYQLFSFGYSNF